MIVWRDEEERSVAMLGQVQVGDAELVGFDDDPWLWGTLFGTDEQFCSTLAAAKAALEAAVSDWLRRAGLGNEPTEAMVEAGARAHFQARWARMILDNPLNDDDPRTTWDNSPKDYIERYELEPMRAALTVALGACAEPTEAMVEAACAAFDRAARAEGWTRERNHKNTFARWMRVALSAALGARGTAARPGEPKARHP